MRIIRCTKVLKCRCITNNLTFKGTGKCAFELYNHFRPVIIIIVFDIAQDFCVVEGSRVLLIRFLAAFFFPSFSLSYIGLPISSLHILSFNLEKKKDFLPIIFDDRKRDLVFCWYWHWLATRYTRIRYFF